MNVLLTMECRRQSADRLKSPYSVGYVENFVHIK